MLLNLVGVFAFGIIVIVCVICLVAVLIKPKHIKIPFSATPPVVARVNAPSFGATEKQRTVHLPTGDKYIIPAGSHGHFVMVFEWEVEVWLDGHEDKIVIPKLATTDFASIPMYLHSLISPLNNTIYAAIIHDYLYRDPEAANAGVIDKATADRIFYWGMRARGVKRLTAGLMFLGVWLGGKSSYVRMRRQHIGQNATPADNGDIQNI